LCAGNRTAFTGIFFIQDPPAGIINYDRSWGSYSGAGERGIVPTLTAGVATGVVSRELWIPRGVCAQDTKLIMASNWGRMKKRIVE